MYNVILITDGGMPFSTRKVVYTGTKVQCGIHRNILELKLKGNQMLLTERAISNELKRYIGSEEWKRHHGYDQPKPKKDEKKATWAFIAKHCIK